MFHTYGESLLPDFSPGIEMEVIDHCSENNGGCAHECTHGTGSAAICSCHKGYQLMLNGKTCEGKEIPLKLYFYDKLLMFNSFSDS